MEELIPIIMFLVIGLVLVTYFYFRSKEKQMMIEKGLSYEQMVELLRTKRDPFIMLKLGIIILFVGLGLGLGFLFQQWTGYQVLYGTGTERWSDYRVHDEWMGFWIVAMTGLGFVTAFLVTRKLKNGNN
jgi:ABC-type Fe3+ transport system permease subunit